MKLRRLFMCIGDWRVEEVVCETGVCVGREVIRGSGYDFVGILYLLGVFVVMEIRRFRESV